MTALLETSFQTGSDLDFVHLRGGNQASEKSGRDFNHWVYWVDL